MTILTKKAPIEQHGLTISTDKEICNVEQNWLTETVTMAIEQGYCPIPMEKDKSTGKLRPAGKFKNGETYPPNHKLWNKALPDIVACRLDRFVLVDYDGNKPEGAIPLDELFAILGDEPNLVQENDKGDSLHYLYKLPADIDMTTLKHSNDRWEHGVDIKTMNQLIHLKKHKTIIDSELPNLSEVQDAPQVIIEALTKPTVEEKERREGSAASKGFAAEIVKYIDPDIAHNEWVNVGMGLKSEFKGDPIGFEIWDNWSYDGAKYKGATYLQYKWDSFNVEGGVTFGTVCHMAKNAGADLAEIRKKYDANGDLLPTFEELLKLAKNMTSETDSSEIEKLIINASQLSTIDTNKIEKQIKRSTGLTQDVFREVKKKNKKQEIAAFNKSYGLPEPAIEKMPINHFIDTKFSMAEGNKPLATIPNIKAMLDYYSITAVYDVIKKKAFYVIPNCKGTSDNRENRAITTCISLAKLNEIPAELVPEYIFAIADSNPINPVTEWILSKEWDGIDRMPEICATLRTKAIYPLDLRNLLVRRWLISAVAAALMPKGFKARGILTLQGDQSLGKTSWLESLVPDLSLKEHLIKVDHILDPENKDSVMTAISHWLVELGELDSTLKKDIAKLKGFITSPRDIIRRPYARVDSEYQRRTVFFASVNDPKFLNDPTGNTRFWTIAVDSVDYKHSIDMQQLWAQVVTLFNNGEQWWLTKDEEKLLENINDSHRVDNVIKELIQCFYNFECKIDNEYVRKSASEVLLDIGFDKPTNPQSKEAGSALRELIGAPTKNQGVSKWKMPPPKHKLTF